MTYNLQSIEALQHQGELVHIIKLTMCSIYPTIIEMKHKSITKEIVVPSVYAYIIVSFHL
jgi:hypothetical protein